MREDHPGVPCEVVDVLEVVHLRVQIATADDVGLAIVIGHATLEGIRFDMGDSPAGSSPQRCLEDLVMAPWLVRETVLVPAEPLGALAGPMPTIVMPHDGYAVVLIVTARLKALGSDLIRLKPVVIRLAWKRRYSTAELLRLPGPCSLVTVVHSVPTGCDCAGLPSHQSIWGT